MERNSRVHSNPKRNVFNVICTVNFLEKFDTTEKSILNIRASVMEVSTTGTRIGVFKKKCLTNNSVVVGGFRNRKMSSVADAGLKYHVHWKILFFQCSCLGQNGINYRLAKTITQNLGKRAGYSKETWRKLFYLQQVPILDLYFPNLFFVFFVVSKVHVPPCHSLRDLFPPPSL